MTTGGSLALIIGGAILKFAVTWSPDGVDLQLVGLILLIAGCVGLVASLAVTISRNRRRGRAQVYQERRFSEPPL